MIVPQNNLQPSSPSGGPTPSPEMLLMAAAEMHNEGKLGSPPPEPKRKPKPRG